LDDSDDSDSEGDGTRNVDSEEDENNMMALQGKRRNIKGYSKNDDEEEDFDHD
jgi:hypothetical protein